MRYLIGSGHGWLGGLGFSAAAIQLADRDHWIGWDVKTRHEQLRRIVGLSRFLIRAAVRCHNLASCVLRMVLRRIDLDFEAPYGYRPGLIESFVETDRFAGTSYQAANWIEIGTTQPMFNTLKKPIVESITCVPIKRRVALQARSWRFS